jgi:hypothetical protein
VISSEVIEEGSRVRNADNVDYAPEYRNLEAFTG